MIVILQFFFSRGYPTLKIFRNGELSSDYNGPREAAGITKFMKAQVNERNIIFLYRTVDLNFSRRKINPVPKSHH